MKVDFHVVRQNFGCAITQSPPAACTTANASSCDGW